MAPVVAAAMAKSIAGGPAPASACLLDALDLMTPAAIRNADASQMVAMKLKGYEELKRIRDQTLKFRNDYTNWRKGRARGAAGEVRQVTTVLETMKLGNDGVGENSESLFANVHKTTVAEEAVVETEEALGGEVDWLKFMHNPFSEKTTHDPLRLTEANIESLRDLKLGTELPLPGSRQAELFIAHIGVGGFHRSHQAYVLHQLMNMQQAEINAGAPPSEKRWGIIGVGLMPWDEKMYTTLKSQDYLYTLLMRSKEGSRSCVVGSIVDFVFVPESPEPSVERLCHPSTRIISLTVTEKGYYRTVSGSLDTSHPFIREDAAAWRGPTSGILQPKTSFGLIATVLVRRKAAGIAPVTVMSCDNLPMNGDTVRSCLVDFFRLVEPSLLEWLDANVPFPNSMVDRITPATEDTHRQLIRDEYGIEDGWPVVAEPFLQWVIEDKFVNGRPSFHKAPGVFFTDKVAPYEFMKLRLLNSTHSALSYVAYLVDHRFVDDAMADCDVAHFVRAYMKEIAETVPSVPGIDLEEYQATLISRFANPYIKDKIVRLCEDGSQKFQNTLLEALHEKLHGSKSSRHSHTQTVPDVVALAIACYMRYMAGQDEAFHKIAIKDPFEATLSPLAQKALNDGDQQAAMAFIRELLGDEVSTWSSFVLRIWQQYQYVVKFGTKTILNENRFKALQYLELEMADIEHKYKDLRKQRLLLMNKEERAMDFQTKKVKKRDSRNNLLALLA